MGEGKGVDRERKGGESSTHRPRSNTEKGGRGGESRESEGREEREKHKKLSELATTKLKEPKGLGNQYNQYF